MIKWCVVSEQGGRPNQEDVGSVYITPNGRIVMSMVLDGHSSSSPSAGDKISQELAKCFQQVANKLSKMPAIFMDDERLRKFIIASCKDVDQYLLKTQKKNAQESGSTLTAFIFNTELNIGYCFSTGDSRTIWFETVKPRKVIQKSNSITNLKKNVTAGPPRKKSVKKGTFGQSVDAKPNDSDELERIEANGGMVVTENDKSEVPRVAGILALSRAFGDFSLKNEFNNSKGDWVTVVPYIYGPIKPKGEFFVISGSDGIFDMMSSNEIVHRALQMINVKRKKPVDADNSLMAEMKKVADAKNNVITATKSIVMKSNDELGVLQNFCRKSTDLCLRRWTERGGADNATLVILQIIPPKEKTEDKTK